jgi:hypothetical protein
MNALYALLMMAALLLLGSCESYGDYDDRSYGNVSLGVSYRGSYWHDPYYNRRCCNYPSRPPAFRPPMGGGRPANLPSLRR